MTQNVTLSRFSNNRGRSARHETKRTGKQNFAIKQRAIRSILSRAIGQVQVSSLPS